MIFFGATTSSMRDNYLSHQDPLFYSKSFTTLKNRKIKPKGSLNRSESVDYYT